MIGGVVGDYLGATIQVGRGGDVMWLGCWMPPLLHAGGLPRLRQARAPACPVTHARSPPHRPRARQVAELAIYMALAADWGAAASNWRPFALLALAAAIPVYYTRRIIATGGAGSKC